MIWPINPPDTDTDDEPPYDDSEEAAWAFHEAQDESLKAVRMDGFPDHLDKHDCRQVQVTCFWCDGDGEDRIGSAFAYEDEPKCCPYCGGRGTIAEDVE
jgi:hypothetical protein